MKDNKTFYNRTITIVTIDGELRRYENARHSIRNGIFYIYTSMNDMTGIPVRQIKHFGVHKEEVLSYGDTRDEEKVEGEV